MSEINKELYDAFIEVGAKEETAAKAANEVNSIKTTLYKHGLMLKYLMVLNTAVGLKIFLS